jgi:lincosamide nucleotidyltransferase
MLPQSHMIEQLRSLCQQDERVAAALLGGSFSVGEGDAYSDIDCVLFFYEDALAELDRRGWVEQIRPTLLFYADDFGHFTAIFDNLIRAEFHFDSVQDMAKVQAWQGSAWFPSLESTLLIDRTGQLACYLQPLIGAPPERDSPAAVEHLTESFANLMLFGLNVLQRGEYARALEMLGLIHRYLLHLARLNERATQHWPTPSRGLEHDISPEAYARFTACTASLEPDDLCRAYQHAWEWGVETAAGLYERHSLTLPQRLLTAISRRVAALTPTGEAAPTPDV